MYVVRDVDPWIMGVVNVTPDSFSDGGAYHHVDDAIAHAHQLRAEGADIIDIGGESTRPGAARISPDEELRRILPVVTTLAAEGFCISVDTTRAAVMVACLAAGAQLINDVSGGRADPQMAQVAADAQVPWVLMHWRGHSARMQELAVYQDVAVEVRAELSQAVDAALAAGVDPSRLILDPGIGFSKTGEQNWELLTHLDVLIDMGLPVLVAVSRKRFLGTLLAVDGTERTAMQRDDATAAISLLAAQAGAWAVRVHRVRPTADALRVRARWAGRDFRDPAMAPITEGQVQQ